MKTKQGAGLSLASGAKAEAEAAKPLCQTDSRDD